MTVREELKPRSGYRLLEHSGWWDWLSELSVLMLTLPLLAGILSGYLLRRSRKVNLDRVSGAIVVVLIFSLGFSIGSDAELLSSFPRIGLSALMMALSAVLFSILFTVWARKKAGLT